MTPAGALCVVSRPSRASLATVSSAPGAAPLRAGVLRQAQRHAFSRAIETDDDDLLVQPAAPEQWKDGKNLVTAQPIDYEPRFSTPNAGRTTFTLSVTWRALERKGVWETMKLGYPFPILRDPDMKIQPPEGMRPSSRSPSHHARLNRGL